jgi:hypothetical protein
MEERHSEAWREKFMKINNNSNIVIEASESISMNLYLFKSVNGKG